MSDEITKRRERRSGAEAIAAAEDPEGWIGVGLKLNALATAVVELGRTGRRLSADQFASEFGRLLPLVTGTIEDLTTLKIGMRAKIVQLTGGRK